MFVFILQQGEISDFKKIQKKYDLIDVVHMYACIIHMCEGKMSSQPTRQTDRLTAVYNKMCYREGTRS